VSIAQLLRRCPPLVGAALGWTIGDATVGAGYVLEPSIFAVVAGLAVWLLVARDSSRRRAGLAVLGLTLGQLAAAPVYRPRFPIDHIVRAPMHARIQLDAVLSADPESNGERARLWLSTQQLDDGRGWRPVQGAVVLTVRHLENQWIAGDILRLRVTLRRPRNFGNPGEFDVEGYWARRGIYVTAFAEDDAGFERVGHVDGSAWEWLARWRRGVGALFRQTLPEPQAAVLSALIIGTEAALPPPLRTAFSRAGVSHVLSISGLHVALVAAAGYALFRWMLARSRWLLLTANVPKLAAALSAVPVLLYAGIAGSNVATTRSVVMILVFVGAVVVDRQRHLLVSLALATLIILATSPGSSLEISFQLSFVAVLGLVLAMQRFWPWWRGWEEAHLLRLRGWRGRLWRPVAVYLAVSVTAWVATTPLTAFHFNQVALVALAANAVAVPLLGSAAVALGLLAAMVYVVSQPAAQVLTLIAGPFVQLGIWVVEGCAAWSYAAVRVVTPTRFELAVLYGGLFALLHLSGRRRVWSVACLTLLALADGGWWYLDRYHRTALRVTFLSVGQGDSAVVEFPGAAVMVIDGGGLGGAGFDVGERVIAPFLWSRKIAHVDYLALSHPEWDHYGGLAFLAEHFSPREFWSNGTAAASQRFVRLQQALADHGVERVVLARGDQRRIGAVDAVVQSPPLQLRGLSVNDQSLVLSLAWGAARILFPGDVEVPAEAAMVAGGDGTLGSTVLKVPHHGSHTSSSARFLDAVAPRLAVVSAGFENRFGFPHRDVVRRYAAHHCALARTDLDGAVQVRLDARGEVAISRHRDVHDDQALTRASVDSVSPQG
jgi:competence protein ComEC